VPILGRFCALVVVTLNFNFVSDLVNHLDNAIALRITLLLDSIEFKVENILDFQEIDN
jgi:hypothetical protein